MGCSVVAPGPHRQEAARRERYIDDPALLQGLFPVWKSRIALRQNAKNRLALNLKT